MNSPLLKETPAAVIVTYEPDDMWAARLHIIALSCPRCLVVDNSVTAASRAYVRKTVSEMKGVELIANSENLGIGGALNLGFKTLRSTGHSWAIAFDQDSTPANGFPEALLTTAAGLAPWHVAVVGANWRDLGRPDHASRHPYGVSCSPLIFRRLLALDDLAKVICVITSGSLFSLQAWHEIGGFDETLFLDLVDTDFCLRASSAGWRVAVSARAKLDHHRGAKRPIVFLGRTYYPSFMSAQRLHNLSRNRLVLYWRHSGHSLAWVSYELIYSVKLLFDIVFLEDHKIKKLTACLLGTWQGFTTYGSGLSSAERAAVI